MKYPRGTIKAFREHLNRLHGRVDQYRTGRNSTGAVNVTGLKKAENGRLYGDYLYDSDREMFMWEMQEEIDKGTFVPPEGKK
jgi:hypothetical protein